MITVNEIVARIPEYELCPEARQALVELDRRGYRIQILVHRGHEGTDTEWLLHIEELACLRSGHDGFVTVEEFSAHWQMYMDILTHGTDGTEALGVDS
jgi:hypothetical protein